MRKESNSMLVLAFFMAFIAIGLFFAGMTRTVHAQPPGPPCNVCEELGTIDEQLSTLDGGVGAIDTELAEIKTDLASTQEKLDKVPPPRRASYYLLPSGLNWLWTVKPCWIRRQGLCGSSPQIQHKQIGIMLVGIVTTKRLVAA